MNPFYDQFKVECLGGEGVGKHELGPFYKSVLYQRGYGLGYQELCPEQMYGLGLGDSLTNLFHMAWPVLRKGLKYLGKSAVSTAADVARDVIEGKDLKESARKHVTKSAQDILARAPAAITGIKEGANRSSSVSSQQIGKRKRSSAATRPSAKRKFGKGLVATYPLLNQL
jgi:hypothetical protein